MIFITLGTFEMAFERLLIEIEKLQLDDEIIIQSGYTNFTSKKYKVIRFLGKEEFENYIDKADIIICHGGVGSILDCLKKGKKIIAVPRLKKYNEHVDNHQVEIVEKLSKNGYILSCMEEDNILKKIEETKNFVVKKYNVNNLNLINFIEDYIKQILI